MSIRREPRTLPERAGRIVLLGLGVAVTLALADPAAHADGTVYKWVDAQNRVHYSDRPPPDGEGQAIAVNTGYSKPASRVSAAPPAKAAAKPADPTAQPAGAAEKKVAADLAAAHAGDCQKAKATYDTYIRVRHLYKQGDAAGGDASGDRQFLTDAQVEQARVDARREMDEACGNAGQ